MKISDLFGKVNNYANPKLGGKNAASDATENRYNEEGSDRTTISPKAVLLAQVSRINSEDEVARAQRVQALKEKVDSGQYLDEVPTDKLAKKVANYLFERV